MSKVYFTHRGNEGGPPSGQFPVQEKQLLRAVSVHDNGAGGKADTPFLHAPYTQLKYGP